MKILNIGVWTLVVVLAVCLGCKYRKDKAKVKRMSELDAGFDDEKDPPLMYREQQKNKRLPKTTDEE